MKEKLKYRVIVRYYLPPSTLYNMHYILHVFCSILYIADKLVAHCSAGWGAMQACNTKDKCALWIPVKFMCKLWFCLHAHLKTHSLLSFKSAQLLTSLQACISVVLYLLKVTLFTSQELNEASVLGCKIIPDFNVFSLRKSEHAG